MFFLKYKANHGKSHLRGHGIWDDMYRRFMKGTDGSTWIMVSSRVIGKSVQVPHRKPMTELKLITRSFCS